MYDVDKPQSKNFKKANAILPILQIREIRGRRLSKPMFMTKVRFEIGASQLTFFNNSPQVIYFGCCQTTASARCEHC